MSAEFWALMGVLVMQLAGMYNNYQTAKAAKVVAETQVKAQAPLVEAQADAAQSEGWVKLAGEYARQIESLKKLEVENAQLRPLVLKLALQEKQMEQDKKDKEDWKRYSQLLVKQLEDIDQIPLPFRRFPSNGDSDKVKAITQNKMSPITEEAQ
jgi:hypothetical protein